MGNSGSTWGTVIILRFVSSLLEALACVSRRDCSILSGNQSHHLRKESCHMGGSGLKSSSIALKLIWANLSLPALLCPRYLGEGEERVWHV